MSNHPLSWNGPQRLQHKARWPPDIVPNAYQETLVEAKATRHVFAVAIAETEYVKLYKTITTINELQ